MQIQGEFKCQNIGIVPKQAHHAIPPLVKMEKSATLHLEMPKLRQERLCLAFLQLTASYLKLDSIHGNKLKFYTQQQNILDMTEKKKKIGFIDYWS